MAFNIFTLVKWHLKLREKFNPYKLFLVSMMMVTPNIQLLPIKLGGRSIGVPVVIAEKKKASLAVKFIIKLLKERMVSLSAKFVADLLGDSIYAKGFAFERKLILYKTGSQNRHLLAKLFRRIKGKKFFKRRKIFKYWKKKKK